MGILIAILRVVLEELILEVGVVRSKVIRVHL